jgi:hypothetical protein
MERRSSASKALPPRIRKKPASFNASKGMIEPQVRHALQGVGSSQITVDMKVATESTVRINLNAYLLSKC